MTCEGTAFLGGCCTVFVVSALASIYVDSDVQKMQARMAAVTELCEKLGSTARSFDLETVTCENGTRAFYKLVRE